MDGSKYMKGAFLMSHKKALGFSNGIFSQEQVESRAAPRGGWEGTGPQFPCIAGLGVSLEARGQRQGACKEKRLFGTRGDESSSAWCPARRVLGWSLRGAAAAWPLSEPRTRCSQKSPGISWI